MSNLTRILTLIIYCCSSAIYAQLSDLARIDYTYIPNAKSNIEYERFRALFNYPVKLKGDDTYLFFGLDYSKINLKSEVEFPFPTGDLRDFQLLDLSIGYTTPMRNNWRLGIRFQPGVSTNLVADALSIKDIVLSGTVIFIKQGKKYNGKHQTLILGVSYAGNSGFNFPLPFVSYFKKFHPDWSFNLGIPKTNLQYYFSQKHKLKAYAQLDGFTSNLQREVALIGGKEARSINMSLILSGLQYEYNFTKRLQLYLRAAYIFSIDTELRNKNRNMIFSLDNEAKIYLRTGIKFKI
ncbi:DUF6268 family outer membrane beta-barrel protein [Kordia sp.]|uniref:DUF6268 family outer membrane beta-barrel protein n=1 Tax=Kordia sp. TaxID=1965332 RepID=UPI0025C4140C|nr:DUF6268 family outer membrane beta-barrel protein [Kordia sp.]MCH2195552.1 DUF6268 family outer membrane beta-barrel protein [Kordia sp.]